MDTISLSFVILLSFDASLTYQVEQLSNPSFNKRIKLVKELEKIGYMGLPAFTRATNHPDPEVRQRVRSLVTHYYISQTPKVRMPSIFYCPKLFNGKIFSGKQLEEYYDKGKCICAERPAECATSIMVNDLISSGHYKYSINALLAEMRWREIHCCPRFAHMEYPKD